jgi:TonB family protein
MRLTAFLFVSLTFHAVALTYPAVFFEPRARELIPVVLLGSSKGSEENVRGGGDAEGKKSRPAKPRSAVSPQRIEEKATDKKDQAAVSKAPSEIFSNSIDVPGKIATTSIFAAPGDAIGSFSKHQENDSTGDNGSGGEGNSGSGSGSGMGSGDGHVGSKFVQVGYAYSPKPEYPDSARREGKEGRVTLRVLVDEQGRSKSVEVNRSSGSQALDQAAADVIQRWRFSPARSGNTPVESWVKILIDFQLTGAKD